ncbi:hypothetical protein QFC22_003820 [Naganishia vaughanmartiniae]|uniref:Uncharacterized protein n=1 Tax=Naganishia vaughanmartiniae TaxID=1424756 RepID=A0ACC2X3H8_9TREE|nr:hypothetical protein QFC22_003820 [Naganishia vaughanmartiniae]
MILPSNNTNNINTAELTASPPAYSATAAPAPKYTPKKDFGKAFGELQGLYGFGGGVPVLASKEEKPKPRTSSDSSVSSTGSKKSFTKALKKFISKSPTASPSTETPPTTKNPAKFVPPARVPSPARRIIESGPCLYTSGANGFTYPLYTSAMFSRPARTSSASSSSSADSLKADMKKKNDKSTARDTAVRGMITGMHGYDTTPASAATSKDKSPGV